MKKKLIINLEVEKLLKNGVKVNVIGKNVTSYHQSSHEKRKMVHFEP